MTVNKRQQRKRNQDKKKFDIYIKNYNEWLIKNSNIEKKFNIIIDKFIDLPKNILDDIYLYASPWKQYKTDFILEELKDIITECERVYRIQHLREIFLNRVWNIIPNYILKINDIFKEIHKRKYHKIGKSVY